MTEQEARNTTIEVVDARIAELEQLIAQKKSEKMSPSEELFERAKKLMMVDPEGAQKMLDLAYKYQYAEAMASRGPKGAQGTGATSVASSQAKAFEGVKDPMGYKLQYDRLASINPALVAGVPPTWEQGGQAFVQSIQAPASKKDVDIKSMAENVTAAMQNVTDQFSYNKARKLIIDRGTASAEDLDNIGLGPQYNPEAVNVMKSGGAAKALENQFNAAKQTAEIKDYTRDLTPKQAEAFDNIVKDITSDTRYRAALDGAEAARRLIEATTAGQAISGVDAVSSSYQYLKAIDPGSVVREAEVKMFADAAGAVATWAEKTKQAMEAAGEADPLAALNRMTITTIPDTVVKRMKAQATSMFNAYKRQIETYAKMAGTRAKVYGVDAQVNEALLGMTPRMVERE
jgi:hypothetical protein